jgi:hypothetical protein
MATRACTVKLAASASWNCLLKLEFNLAWPECGLNWWRSARRALKKQPRTVGLVLQRRGIIHHDHDLVLTERRSLEKSL